MTSLAFDFTARVALNVCFFFLAMVCARSVIQHLSLCNNRLALS
jgi:hypothetical protein